LVTDVENVAAVFCVLLRARREDSDRERVAASVCVWSKKAANASERAPAGLWACEATWARRLGANVHRSFASVIDLSCAEAPPVGVHQSARLASAADDR